MTTKIKSRASQQACIGGNMKSSIKLKPVEFPADMYVESLPPPSISSGVLLVKRLFDLSGTLLALILAAPLMLLTAVLIKLTSAGPVFYKQERIGRNGVKFNLVKFRSMRVDAEKNGAVWADESKGKKDPRVTPIGNFLRKSHLDELPQLFLVLGGMMSLVGPRPERPELAKPLARDIVYFKQRVVNLKPGMTGISQMHREQVDDVGINEKLLGDHAYGIFLCRANTWSILTLDTRIMVYTVLNILFKRGASKGHNGK